MVRAWDVDGIIAKFNSAFINLIKEQTGIELPPESDTYPDTWSYHRAAGVTKEQDQVLWNHIMEGDFWETLDHYPEAPAALALIRECRSKGDHIYFVTSRPGQYAKHLTEFWLDNLGYECPTVLISSNKGPVCKGLGVEMFVDDKPENCIDVALSCSRAQVYLLDAPYNRKVLYLPTNVTRITSILDPRLYSEAPRAVAA